jgi:hypothetical protein
LLTTPVGTLNRDETVSEHKAKVKISTRAVFGGGKMRLFPQGTCVTDTHQNR